MMPRFDHHIASVDSSDTLHTAQIAERIYISKSAGLYGTLRIWERATFPTQRTVERHARKDLGLRSSFVLISFSMPEMKP